MNNRQAGAFREMVRKEEAASLKWQQDQDEYSRSIEMDGEQGGTPRMDDRDQNYNQTGGGGGGGGRGPRSPGSSRRGGGGYEEDEPQQYDASIYDNAIRISTPQFVDDGEDIPQYVQRKVVRQVELPYTRQVKVPVRTRKIVPTKVQKKVRTTKLVEVPSFKMVDETYTEVVQQPAVRNKEIWVKKIVPEKYMEKVPVQRTRRVKVPTTVIQEVDDYEIVEVSGSKAIEVDGYRIDEVEDRKVVEVEEYQTYQLNPQATGPAKIDNARDIGPVGGHHHSRKIGSQVYHLNDHRVSNMVEDQHPDDNARASHTMGGSMRNGTGRGKARSSGGGRAHAAQLKSMPRPNNKAPLPLGIKLSDNTDKNCVSVNQVSEGSPAMVAGICKGDSIMRVNNKPTRNLNEFRMVVGNAPGNLSIQIRRGGAYKLTVTVAR